MAVKVMLAPSLVREADAVAKKRGAEPKPRRRRSSVYDADGNEVFITLMCLKCRKMRPLSQFGLRKMADGAIRNQPWCRSCRSGAGADRAGRRAADDATPPIVAEPALAAPGVPAQEKPVDPGLLAAQVVAALHGGRR